MSEQFARVLLANLDKEIAKISRLTAAGYINPARIALKAYRRAVRDTMRELGHTDL